MPVENVTQLPLDRVTLGDAMKKAGYATALFGKWHLGQQGKYHPSARGFDEAITSMGKHFDFATQPKVDYPKGAYLADWLTDKSLAFIDKNKDRPFFLCLHHFGVHAPHEAKPELVERFKRKPGAGGHNDPTYAAMIYSVDESVGRVLAETRRVETLGQYARDLHHGQRRCGRVRRGRRQDEGGDHQQRASSRRQGNALRGRHPRTVHRPLAGEGEGGGDMRGTDHRRRSLPDPTDARRIPQPKPGQVLDGTSITPLLFGNGGRRRARRATPLYWHFPGYLGAGKDGWRTTPAGAIRAADWKLIEFFETGTIELYNLAEDIGEKNDLAKAMPDRAKAMHDDLKMWRTSVDAPMPAKRAK